MHIMAPRLSKSPQKLIELQEDGDHPPAGEELAVVLHHLIRLAHKVQCLLLYSQQKDLIEVCVCVWGGVSGEER